MAKPYKKPAPVDATMRNIRSVNKRLAQFDARLGALSARLSLLEDLSTRAAPSATTAPLDAAAPSE